MLLVDGMLSGTGIRDGRAGGYLDPARLGLSDRLSGELDSWLARYEDAHYAGFPPDAITRLDEEGLAISEKIRGELGDTEVGYFSNGLMKRLA